MKNLNLIGIDVSEASIKVLQLGKNNSTVAYESAALPAGVVQRGNVLDGEAFSKALNDVLGKIDPQLLDNKDSVFHAVLCMPESKLFSHHCVVPADIKKADFETYVRGEAEKIIPLKFENIYWNYHVAEENGVNNATFVGVKKSDLDAYVKAFKSANVEPTFIGGELFALGRSLLPNPPFQDDYIILDIGAYSTTIGIFSVDAVPNMSILVQRGGNSFTRHVSESLGVSVEEAERLKREYGVDSAHEDARVPGALRDNMSLLIDKVIEAKNYFENKSGNPIKHIIVAGGSALMPKICDFIAGRTGVETLVANPVQKIKEHDLLDKSIHGIFLANVIGLALPENYEKFSHLNLFTQYQHDPKNIIDQHPASRQIRSLSDFRDVLYILWKKNLAILLPKIKLILTATLLIVAVSFLLWVLVSYL